MNQIDPVIECSYVKSIDPALFARTWPELCAKIDVHDALSCSIFLSRLYVFWIAEKPIIKHFVYDSDSMGGLCISLEMASPCGRMWIDYEHSLRESWSSLEVLKSEGGVEFSFCQPYRWTMNLIGSGVLELRLPHRIDSSLEAVLNLAREHFEEVTLR